MLPKILGSLLDWRSWVASKFLVFGRIWNSIGWLIGKKGFFLWELKIIMINLWYWTTSFSLFFLRFFCESVFLIWQLADNDLYGLLCLRRNYDQFCYPNSTFFNGRELLVLASSSTGFFKVQTLLQRDETCNNSLIEECQLRARVHEICLYILSFADVPWVNSSKILTS